MQAQNVLNHVVITNWGTVLGSNQLRPRHQCRADAAAHVECEVPVLMRSLDCDSSHRCAGHCSAAERGHVQDHHQARRDQRLRQGQERQSDRRPEGVGLHRHRRRQAAADYVSSSTSGSMTDSCPAPALKTRPAKLQPEPPPSRCRKPDRTVRAPKRSSTGPAAARAVLRFGGHAGRGPDRAQQSALRFLNTRMTSSDLVAVMTYATTLNVLQDFTDDRDRLTTVIRGTADRRNRHGQRRHGRRERSRYRRGIHAGRQRIQHLQHGPKTRRAGIGRADAEQPCRRRRRSSISPAA